MPEKELTNYTWIQWAWVFGLSLLGGSAAYLNQLGVERRRFHWGEFGAKLTVSGFVGVLAFLVCEASGISPMWSAAAVGMSGYLGSEAVNLLKAVIFRRLPRVEKEEGK